MFGINFSKYDITVIPRVTEICLGLQIKKHTIPIGFAEFISVYCSVYWFLFDVQTFHFIPLLHSIYMNVHETFFSLHSTAYDQLSFHQLCYLITGIQLNRSELSFGSSNRYVHTSVYKQQQHSASTRGSGHTAAPLVCIGDAISRLECYLVHFMS